MSRISAMFFSGWILMLPPVTYNKSAEKFDINLQAPYSQWEQHLAFDTARECSNERIHLYNVGKKYLDNRDAEWKKVLDELGAKYPDQFEERMRTLKTLEKRMADLHQKKSENWSKQEREESLILLQEYVALLKRDLPVDERIRKEFEERTEAMQAKALAYLQARCVASEIVFPPQPKR